ncbi:MAG: DUF2633 family protein [Serratia liquefaciens]|nr:DUF2633 family protein [Serratia liquefaciens]
MRKKSTGQMTKIVLFVSFIILVGRLLYAAQIHIPQQGLRIVKQPAVGQHFGASDPLLIPQQLLPFHKNDACAHYALSCLELVCKDH